MNPLLHSFTGTAARIGVSRSHVYRLVNQGALVRVKIGRRALITEESINRFIVEVAK